MAILHMRDFAASSLLLGLVSPAPSPALSDAPPQISPLLFLFQWLLCQVWPSIVSTFVIWDQGQPGKTWSCFFALPISFVSLLSPLFSLVQVLWVVWASVWFRRLAVAVSSGSLWRECSNPKMQLRLRLTAINLSVLGFMPRCVRVAVGTKVANENLTREFVKWAWPWLPSWLWWWLLSSCFKRFSHVCRLCSPNPLLGTRLSCFGLRHRLMLPL